MVIQSVRCEVTRKFRQPVRNKDEPTFASSRAFLNCQSINRYRKIIVALQPRAKGPTLLLTGTEVQ